MRVRLLAATVASVMLMSVVACGRSGSSAGAGSTATPSARTLASDAINALRSAQSVRFDGTVTVSGRSVSLHMGFFRSGDVSGTVMASLVGGAAISVRLLGLGRTYYIMISKEYFSRVLQAAGLPAADCAKLCGKYLKVPAARFGNLAEVLRDKLFKGNFNTNVEPGVTIATVNGEAAYRLTSGPHTNIYVARYGTHYLLKASMSGQGAVVFSEWNSVPPVTPPPASQVVKLPGSSGSSGTA